MPMTRALTVLLRGAMPQDTLLRLRELMHLQRRGRLTDAEDVFFGYQHLQHDEQNWISLDLIRQDEVHWKFVLTYLKAPPTDDLVSQTLAQIRAAADSLGFTVHDVVR